MKKMMMLILSLCATLNLVGFSLDSISSLFSSNQNQVQDKFAGLNKLGNRRLEKRLVALELKRIGVEEDIARAEKLLHNMDEYEEREFYREFCDSCVNNKDTADIENPFYYGETVTCENVAQKLAAAEQMLRQKTEVPPCKWIATPEKRIKRLEKISEEKTYILDLLNARKQSKVEDQK
jgi:hypothetical protein